jgi:hypothetical protein
VRSIDKRVVSQITSDTDLSEIESKEEVIAFERPKPRKDKKYYEIEVVI